MGHDSENCKRIFALLSQYIDLELPEDACAEIERHLEGCSPCVDFAESLRKTVDLCRRYQSDATPRPLAESARQELERAWRQMLQERK